METVFTSIPLPELETRISAIVEEAVSRALASKEPAKYYTIQEAARYTGKALSTLYTDHSKGKLQSYKSGRHLRFSEKQLTDYLEGRNSDQGEN